VRGQRIAPNQRIAVKAGEKVFIGPMPLRIQSEAREVAVVIDDARHYAETATERFDLIVLSHLDAHESLSSFTNVRLDNYIYTVEGIRAGWGHVKEGGVLAISFSTLGGPWLEQRLIKTIREATGRVPVVVRDGDVLDFGTSFIVVRGAFDQELLSPTVRRLMATAAVDESIRIPTDDWPFLYIRPGSFPWGYLTVMLMIGVSGVIAIRRAYGAAATEGGVRIPFDWPMFFMGAGFMLLETRMVTALSLLFGSTWIVNAFVFGGVLLMVLLANFWVSRRPLQPISRWFIPLLASVLLTTVIIRAGALAGLPMGLRGALGGVLFALPIGFAGVIVATLLARSPSAALSLGANLMGAVLGGILEYSSMFFGLTFVGALSLACYVAAWVALRRRGQPASAA